MRGYWEIPGFRDQEASSGGKVLSLALPNRSTERLAEGLSGDGGLRGSPADQPADK